jgi:hypothetical protein
VALCHDYPIFKKINNIFQRRFNHRVATGFFA